jgi:hypothetical protein
MLTDAWLAQILADPEVRRRNPHLIEGAPPSPMSVFPIADTLLPKYRSKTEARYAELLKWRQASGEIEDWWYEPMSLRLGASSHYCPDFLVQRPGTFLLEFIEVKGTFIRARALDKPKAAATRFPCMLFTLAVWDRKTWTETRIAAHI